MKKALLAILFLLLFKVADAQYVALYSGYTYEQNSFDRSFLSNLQLDGRLGAGFSKHLELTGGVKLGIGQLLFPIYNDKYQIYRFNEDEEKTELHFQSYSIGIGIGYISKFFFKPHDNSHPEGLYVASNIEYNTYWERISVYDVFHDYGDGPVSDDFYYNKHYGIHDYQKVFLKKGFRAGVQFEGAFDAVDVYMGLNYNSTFDRENILIPAKRVSLQFGIITGLIW